MKVYSKNEIESISSKLIADIHNRNPHIDINDLCMLLLYGASYILYVSSPSPSTILPRVGSLAFNFLTSPISHRLEDAPLSISKESSEVQGDNREDSANPSEG